VYLAILTFAFGEDESVRAFSGRSFLDVVIAALLPASKAVR
jgi:hypothetical protein